MTDKSPKDTEMCFRMGFVLIWAFFFYAFD
jgi:hypothetical protein